MKSHPHPCRIIPNHLPYMEASVQPRTGREPISAQGGGVCCLRLNPERSAQRGIKAPEKHAIARAQPLLIGKVAHLQRWNSYAWAIFWSQHTGHILLGYLKLIFQTEVEFLCVFVPFKYIINMRFLT